MYYLKIKNHTVDFPLVVSWECHVIVSKCGVVNIEKYVFTCFFLILSYSQEKFVTEVGKIIIIADV